MEQNKDRLVFGFGDGRLELCYLFESDRRGSETRQDRMYALIPPELSEQMVEKKDSMSVMPGPYSCNSMINISNDCIYTMLILKASSKTSTFEKEMQN